MLLACMKNVSVVNSSSFQWHDIRTKFCENSSNGAVSVLTEVQWVGDIC
jgi:hypothetical protein